MDNRTFDAPLQPVSPGATANADTSAETGLLVRRSDESVARFDSSRIVESLVQEAGVHPDTARLISEEIQTIVQKSGFARLTSSLLRSLVDAKLVEHGLEKEYLAYSRLGVPFYDVDRIVHQHRVRASPFPLTPEGTSVLLAEAIKREYAILSVFSPPIANAHLIGDIFIQDLGAVDRPYSITQSLDAVKRHGFTLPNRFAASRPARRPEVLVAHLVKSSSALQGYFNGPVEWDSVNYGLAPFVEGLSRRNIQQVAQSLIFELSATSVTRGGQASACTLHLDWDPPPYLADRPAIGPGGELTGKTYSECAPAARALLRAMFEAYRDGDGQKLPFAGARPVLHITPENAEREECRQLIEETCQTVIERGGVWFAFDRDPAASFSQRYGIPLEGSWENAGSHEWRAAAFQAVAVNLPRAAHRAGAADVAGIFEELTRLMEVAAQAHLEKRVFLEKLLALGENGPLALLTLRRDNAAFLRLSRTTHRICPVGLNELAWCVTGRQFHESHLAREFGARVIACLTTEAARLSSRHKTRFVLAESHAEGMAARLAHMDMRFFPEDAAERVQGTPAANDVHYSNGVKIASKAAIPLVERIQWEGELQNGSLLNATSDIFFGEKLPTAAEIAELVVASCRHSQTAGLLFSPEFTLCFDCHHIGHGLKPICEACGSANVDGLAQATNRYSHTSSWSRAMLGELQRRFRGNFSV